MNKRSFMVFRAECLKLKHTKVYSLIFFVTLTAPLLAYLVGGKLIFIPFTLYWWEALLLFLLISLLFLRDNRSEAAAGNFQNIAGTALKKQIYFSKVWLLFLEVLLASVELLVEIYLVAALYGGLLPAELLRLVVVTCLLLLASLWDIFFVYYLASWLNAYLVAVSNSLCCLLLAPLLAQTSWWPLFPYTYHYKVVEAVVGLAPNGVPASALLNIDQKILALSVGLALFWVGLLAVLLRGRSNDKNVKV